MAGRVAIKDAILILVPDNTSELVSPEDVRDSTDLIIDNFYNIDDNAITNGLTYNGITGDIKWGGAITENVTVDGASTYGVVFDNLAVYSAKAETVITQELYGTVIGASSKTTMVGGQLDFLSYDAASFGGNETGIIVSTSLGSGVVYVKDEQAQKGLAALLPSDYANLNWATDNNFYAPIGVIKANVSGLGGADNGLSVNVSTAQLGGELIQNTTISLYDSLGLVNRNLTVTKDIGLTSFFELNADGSWTLGENASSSDATQVVLGQNATTTSSGGVVAGRGASGGSGLTVVCIGDSTTVTGARGVTIGYSSSSEAGISMGIGASSTNTGIAGGQGASATNANSLAWGFNASSTGGTALGANASVLTTGVSIAAIVTGTRGIGIGAGSANITTTDSIGIGSFLTTLGNNAYLMGRGVKASTNGISFGFGAGSTSGTFGSDAITIGTEANGNVENVGSSSISIGKNTAASATGAVIVGYGTAAGTPLVNSVTDSFGFGFGSLTPDFLYSNSGKWLVKSLPTFADDVSAGGGGVLTDEIYKTATGELRIKL